MSRGAITAKPTSLLLLLCLVISGPLAQGQEFNNRPKYSPKFGVRAGFGTLNNSAGTSTGLANRGIDAYVVYYFTSAIALGAGYQIDPPFSAGKVFGRYYFYGQGTRSTIRHPLVTSERHDRLSVYAGGELGQRSYSYPLPRDPDSIKTDSLTGNTGSFNIIIGADHRISSHFDLNAELSVGTLSLYTSDPRITILGNILLVGISYIW